MGKCCLCSAYQKLFSAISVLSKINVDGDFFDNISNIDNFFSEFRNITFILQKAMKDNNQAELYEQARNKFLVNEDMKWFVEKRNETVKQEPFNLVKNLDIYLYPFGARVLYRKLSFNMENDIPIRQIEAELKKELSQKQSKEIFGTIIFSFSDGKKTEQIDIFNKILNGVKIMREFLDYIKKELNIKCTVCNKLKNRIYDLMSKLAGIKMTFIADFEYLKSYNQFSFGTQTKLIIGLDDDVVEQQDMKMDKVLFGENNYGIDEIYFNFILTHLTTYKMTKTIVPTFMVVYEDNSFTYSTFQIDTKATYYRYANDIAQKISTENIKAVAYVGEMYLYPDISREELNLNYREREKCNKEEILCFAYIDKDLKKDNIFIKKKKCDDYEYITKQFRERNLIDLFSFGVIEFAFTNKKNKKND